MIKEAKLGDRIRKFERRGSAPVFPKNFHTKLSEAKSDTGSAKKG